MFGDFGHGLIMTLFALWMILKEKPLSAQKTDNEVSTVKRSHSCVWITDRSKLKLLLYSLWQIWNIFFGGRYIIFLMGAFSMYTGLIYNDVFSKSLNVFGSNWEINYNTSTMMKNDELQLDPKYDFKNSAYPFGMDPIWQVARSNKIIFHNGYKMKISIIFGVLQMMFGVIMSYRNYRYFNDQLSVLTMFAPQMIFLISLFAYMALLMFIKWFTYSALSEPPYNPGCAPSILITFINMVLMKPAEDHLPCKAYMFWGQGGLQMFFVFAAFICIPWMLLAKPLHIMRSRKQAAVITRIPFHVPFFFRFKKPIV